ncbi:MAG TPA: hypothetical protein VG895_01870 [Patescibacteria group bacterium]|nr:hypothetical protein [Patescibacteria group bacterium]
MNRNIIYIIIILLVLFGGYLFFKNQNDSSYNVIHTNQKHTPLPSFPAETNIVSTPEPINITTNSENKIQDNSNSISCNYVTPAGPDMQGTAKINYSWVNSKTSLCDSVNGGSNNLLINNQNLNGSDIYNANWISLNTSYQFNLFNDLNCNGQIIESCNINQPSPTTAPNTGGQKSFGR